MNVKLPKLEIWQQDLFNKYLENTNGKIFVTKSTRQVGKSAIITLLLVYASLKESNSISKAISPIFQQANKLFEDTAKLAGKLVARKNGSDLTLTFINGSKVQFSSAEQGDNLRGYTIKKSGILAIDEAAYIDSDFFYGVLLPMTNVHNSDIFLFSTPRARQGMFYELFQSGLNDKDGKIISCDWTAYDTSKYLNQETLEVYRKQLPIQIFRAEFLGQWIENESSVFGDFSKVLKDKVSKDIETFFGIDWGTGTGGDYTAISIFNSKKEMVDIVYFNDKDETATIGEIVKLANKYRPTKIIVETNSIGNVYYGLLKKAIQKSGIKSQVIGFTTTNDSKDKIICNMQVLIQESKCSLLNNEELIKQMNGYEMTFSKNGKRVYNNGKNADHDDLVMATAICLYNIDGKNYNISVL